MKKGYKNLKEFLDAPGTIGLVVEGGGMRGITTASMLKALADHGYWKRFEQGTGSSVGAANLAYFMGNQIEDAIMLYSEVMPNNEFVKFTRFNKIMDIRVLENFMRKDLETKLETKEIVKHPMNVIVPLSSIDELKQKPFVLKDSDDQVNLLCAGMSIPVLDNETRTVEGKNYIDGGTLDILPIHLIDGTCDRYLVLRSDRKLRYRPHKILFALFSKFQYGLTFKIGINATILSNNYKLKAFKRMKKKDIAVLYPPKNHKLNRITRNKDKLHRASKLTIAMMDNLLS